MSSTHSFEIEKFDSEDEAIQNEGVSVNANASTKTPGASKSKKIKISRAKSEVLPRGGSAWPCGAVRRFRPFRRVVPHEGAEQGGGERQSVPFLFPPLLPASILDQSSPWISSASTTAKIDLPLVAIADAADLDHPLAHRRLPLPQQFSCDPFTEQEENSRVKTYIPQNTMSAALLEAKLHCIDTPNQTEYCRPSLKRRSQSRALDGRSRSALMKTLIDLLLLLILLLEINFPCEYGQTQFNSPTTSLTQPKVKGGREPEPNWIEQILPVTERLFFQPQSQLAVKGHFLTQIGSLVDKEGHPPWNFVSVLGDAF
nr:hypothetical protein Iba_chr04dCG13360 [Ipomoea batatas]